MLAKDEGQAVQLTRASLLQVARSSNEFEAFPRELSARRLDAHLFGDADSDAVRRTEC
jgi:hypothetical protein